MSLDLKTMTYSDILEFAKDLECMGLKDGEIVIMTQILSIAMSENISLLQATIKYMNFRRKIYENLKALSLKPKA